MNFTQRTLKSMVTAEGVGFHTGKACVVRLSPQPVNAGILFTFRNKMVRASIENVDEIIPQTTSIRVGSKIVSTVEHVLSALYGLRITNACIEIIDGTEIPIIDGSAAPWVVLINHAGILNQNAIIVPRILRQPLTVTCDHSTYHLMPFKQYLMISAKIDFKHTIIGEQTYTFRHTGDNYVRTIANARTFIADGADGAVLNRRKIFKRLKSVDLAHPEMSPCILYQGMKYITPLRFAKEPVAHKLLDMLGDLSLLGFPLHCIIEAQRPSHLGNRLVVKRLLENLTLLPTDS